MPFCEPDPLVEIQKQMEFVSVVLPPWLHVFPVSNRSSAQYYVPTVNQTVTLPSGDVLTTFRSAGGEHTTLFVHVLNKRDNFTKTGSGQT